MTTKISKKPSQAKKPASPAGLPKKKDLVEQYRSHEQDTGSVEVQIALLSQRIASLAKHLRAHNKDNDSRRGLLMMVGKRRRLLNYLRQNEPKKYDKLILDLKLKK